MVEISAKFDVEVGWPWVPTAIGLVEQVSGIAVGAASIEVGVVVIVIVVVVVVASVVEHFEAVEVGSVVAVAVFAVGSVEVAAGLIV